MFRWLPRAFAVLAALLAAVIGLALVGIFSAPPPRAPASDVFGFARDRSAADELPALDRYRARDGSHLAWRFYPAASARLVVLLHGSSYHGAYLDPLARAITARNLAQVAVPNLRGHYQSGLQRGDVDFIGQLEDDVADLITVARERGATGPVVVGGHSSGGGLAIRFAAGPYGDLADGALLLSPMLPLAPTTRGGDAGGWAVVHLNRLYGLLVLNGLGIHLLDGLPVIRFHKPEAFWDGTETLSYSYRLNTSYHPRADWTQDLRALPGDTLLVVGERDEANVAAGFAPLLAEHAPETEVIVLPGVDHFGAVLDPAAVAVVTGWLATHALALAP